MLSWVTSMRRQCNVQVSLESSHQDESFDGGALLRSQYRMLAIEPSWAYSINHKQKSREMTRAMAIAEPRTDCGEIIEYMDNANGAHDDALTWRRRSSGDSDEMKVCSYDARRRSLTKQTVILISSIPNTLAHKRNSWRLPTSFSKSPSFLPWILHKPMPGTEYKQGWNKPVWRSKRYRRARTIYQASGAR